MQLEHLLTKLVVTGTHSIAITQLAYGKSYTLDITRGGTTTQVTFATPTTGGTATSVEAIRDDLVSDMVNAMTGWVNVVGIGNGIYLEDDEEFTVETPELQLLDIIATAEEEEDPPGTVVARYAATQNIAQLPIQCRNGFVTKITNSFSDEDDYYVVFRGNLDQDGEGVWEETVQPGLFNQFEETLMPHRIIRGPVNAGIFTFVVNAIPWDDREVGDNLTNPYPSFINAEDPDNTAGANAIERVVFYRNRLCLLAGENIIMSRPGDYLTFGRSRRLI